ncbi:hypothetical protein PHYBLDRAFT_140446 [Phycomyces blakesleeanus NRRL 1555(-)]|uniref:Uncharacterized protein n=1 Tax=Phycomyces blakesleeanus (strain ATCC 8743b / DSM 1359 / FGSC 10004 / NBRC 33097 / NRRL 1555) TaxID=763407 RepID=A0A167PQ95_PHYB8|nr:hypothetical protein PHYBLDRAFT_140446 [Phycomyces blakesleeanus NRRL 1555(-)]OAD78346.1 hypothetical protein PHYBLDRAFT_140446 [Phycomyces blakesleeanus NRRL 1555(-)]|eukprot:XP_018296386.1 hypothetical protein PHYBLDRAFT_140446 [Phycomyces blakesleeanus NRRL 1555(-)]
MYAARAAYLQSRSGPGVTRPLPITGSSSQCRDLDPQLLDVKRRTDRQYEVGARVLALRSGHKWREYGNAQIY